MNDVDVSHCMSTRNATDAVILVALAILAVLVLFPLMMMVFAAPMMGGWMGGWMGGTQRAVSPLWGVGMTLLWLAVLVGLGYVGYRALAGSR